jgi:anthranilate synthase
MTSSYTTESGIRVDRETELLPKGAMNELAAQLDAQLGGLFECSYAQATRYKERSVGFSSPVMRLVGRQDSSSLELLKSSGAALFAFLCDHVVTVLGPKYDARMTPGALTVYPPTNHERLKREEDRSRVPSTLDLLRVIGDAFAAGDDDSLGLYGAFAYDAVLQFEPSLTRSLSRPLKHRDFVLYLPDRLLISYPGLDATVATTYSFTPPAGSGTVCQSSIFPAEEGVRISASDEKSVPLRPSFHTGVKAAQAAFSRGDLFEVVLSQVYERTFDGKASTAYAQLSSSNVAPYSTHLNLGGGEHLIVSSPEMFLRVTGRTVESAPIAGTISRGATALEDFEHLKDLLLSEKADSELVMCTDVDRNDKSRVCTPGTVEVLAHRDIEMTSRVIHTVEHISGQLREDASPLDAFISHMWAVTVTGAPKIAAMDFIETTEASARGWYAGAFGKFLFDGSIDTGITIRAIQLDGATARVRAGSSLLSKSVPSVEEAECDLKASAMLAVLDGAPASARPLEASSLVRVKARGLRTVMVDHEDSFVHTLADYLRRAGCDVTTVRSPRGQGLEENLLLDLAPEFLCLSPGPGSPDEFQIGRLLDYARRHEIPTFGVCLGLQAIAEYEGGSLRMLETPAHGVSSVIRRAPTSTLLQDLPETFSAGRYHSLEIVLSSDAGPDHVTSETADGTVMSMEIPEHRLYGVQFHPESIMSAGDKHGQLIIDRMTEIARAHQRQEQR